MYVFDKCVRRRKCVLSSHLYFKYNCKAVAVYKLITCIYATIKHWCNFVLLLLVSMKRSGPPSYPVNELFHDTVPLSIDFEPVSSVRYWNNGELEAYNPSYLMEQVYTEPLVSIVTFQGLTFHYIFTQHGIRGLLKNNQRTFDNIK